MHGLFQLQPINLEHLTDIRICSICLAYHTGRVRNRILHIYKYESRPPAQSNKTKHTSIKKLKQNSKKNKPSFAVSKLEVSVNEL